MQDVDTRIGCGQGVVRREEGGQVMGYRIDGQTEAAELKTPAYTIGAPLALLTSAECSAEIEAIDSLTLS